MTRTYLASFVLDGRPRPVPPRLAALLAASGCKATTNGALTLFVDGGQRVRRAADGAGFVLGQVFEGDEAAPNELTLGLSGEAIVRHYWGSYVALLPRPDSLTIVRDPSGGLGCYHAVSNGIFYATSAPHLLFDAGILTPDLDWEVIGQSLTRHATRGAATALRGIAEVLPGTALSVSASGSSHHPVWDPWRSAGAPPPRDPAGALHDVLAATLAAWGRTVSRPLIEISGGLDSAIVAAGIAPAAPSASLITFAAVPGDPDETLYARAIADHLGLDLRIAHPQVGDVDLTVSLSHDLPRPNARAFVQAADRESLRHAQEIDADAFVSGGGGDDVFCYLRTILPALDRLEDEGVVPMLATLGDIARMNHATVWDAVRLLARRMVRGKSGKAVGDVSMLGPQFRELEPVVAAQASNRNGRPGKADHVAGVLSIHNYLEGNMRSGFAPILSPLLSQPIVECCLSIPAWRWCEGGRNRAVARRSFMDRLPPLVIERRSKGSFDGFCAQLFETNRQLIGELLLAGRLVENGLVDPSAVALALQTPFPPAATITRALALVDVESWVRSWQSRPFQRL